MSRYLNELNRCNKNSFLLIKYACSLQVWSILYSLLLRSCLQVFIVESLMTAVIFQCKNLLPLLLLSAWKPYKIVQYLCKLEFYWRNKRLFSKKNGNCFFSISYYLIKLSYCIFWFRVLWRSVCFDCLILFILFLIQQM